MTRPAQTFKDRNMIITTPSPANNSRNGESIIELCFSSTLVLGKIEMQGAVYVVNILCVVGGAELVKI